jgi:hypothetical protein
MKLGFSSHQMLRHERDISGESTVRWRTMLNLGTEFGNTAMMCGVLMLSAAFAVSFFQAVFEALAISELWFRIPLAIALIWFGSLNLRYVPYLFACMRRGWIDGGALAMVTLMLPTVSLVVWWVLTFDLIRALDTPSG